MCLCASFLSLPAPALASAPLSVSSSSPQSPASFPLVSFPPTGIYTSYPPTHPSPPLFESPLPSAPPFLGPAKSLVPPARRYVSSYSAYQPWYETRIVGGRRILVDTEDAHLIQAHHLDPALLVGLSQDEKNRLHGKAHTSPSSFISSVRPSLPPPRSPPVLRLPVSVSPSPCPGGVCPIRRR